jgi:hypothetical protein
VLEMRVSFFQTSPQRLAPVSMPPFDGGSVLKVSQRSASSPLPEALQL